MGATRYSVAGVAVENGKVFIARRVPGGGLGGKWEFPGGKVEAGESDEAALIREFQEEFAVTVRPGPFLGSASFEHRGETRVLRAYRVYLESRDFILSEHTAWDWVFPETIAGLDFAGSDMKLLPELAQHLGLFQN
ncbi:MAG: (deoxy)nucleoside triphosphate pyrophosphohydrolase [Spirochaetaceae bacterium]|jgi:8-oxo-dGTP diphosphatase|nr:(deoxy)nucleoside triphosphate pyrophosphohydrolase [Spirochaetaceae bacterium]